MENVLRCKESIFSTLQIKLLAEPPKQQSKTDNTGDVGSIPFADEVVVGELRPANDPTPPNACDRLLNEPDAMAVLIGDNVIGSNRYGESVILQIGTCDAASVERNVEGVVFNAQLVDLDDNQVVTIKRNKINSLNGETYKARQSNDRASLTVSNNKGKILFYVRFLNKNILRIRGYFGCGGQRPPLLVRDDQPIPGFFMAHSCNWNNGAGGIHVD
jgi:hypothetical protein